MGSCQTNSQCTREIKTNNKLTDNEINIKEEKEIIEDAKISNEEIKIVIPLRSFSLTKKKENKEENNNNRKNMIKRKSFALSTANKTPNNTINIKQSGEYNEINNNKMNNILLKSLISNNTNNDINNNKKLLRNIDNNIKNEEQEEEENLNKNKHNNKDKNCKNCKYENLQIEDIIPEYKIHTKNNNEIVFRGNLLLIKSDGEIKNKNLYCILSRINLKLYEDINSFIKMKKPIIIIKLKLIKDIHIIKDEHYGLCFSLLNNFIFHSQNKEQLFKWTVVLNYFSSKLQS